LHDHERPGVVTGAANGQPFDLDAAVKAAYAESKPVPFTFTYHGQTYTVPPATDWPIEAQAMIGAGDIEPAMRMILGGETYQALSSAGMTMGELTLLLGKVGEHAGLDGLGNSPQPAARASTPT
jgi:hypothetical protein